MMSHRQRTRSRFQLESLEGRIALSGVGGVDDGAHHDRGGPAEVRGGRHGADDPAGHDANDDKGGVRALRQGADDPATHDANDDKGGTASGVHRHQGGRVAAVKVHHRGEPPAGHK